LVPCGSASSASRLNVVGAVPIGAKMLLRAVSNVWVCEGVPAAGVDGVEGAAAGLDTVRCGGVGAVAAGAGGAAVAGADGGGLRGGGGLGGAVTVMVGTVVVPGVAGVVPGVGCPCGEAGGCSVCCGDGGVWPAGGAGVGAGAAGALVCGVCGDPFCCVCEAAMPTQQLSNTSEELLRSSKRLLRLDIFDPHSFSSENDHPHLQPDL